MAEKKVLPLYRIEGESFYDNLVLWPVGSEIEWEGSPSPFMVPLNVEAQEKLAEWYKERGDNFVPPLSELADTMDGRVTVTNFAPGDRKNRGQAKVVPPFPVVPGKYGSGKTGANGLGETLKNEFADLPPMPKKPIKNFDRAPR